MICREISWSRLSGPYRDARKSLIAQPNPNASAWSTTTFLVALFVWGSDSVGQLLKAFGFTFRAAAALPVAVIHFVYSVEAYDTMFEQVRTAV